MWEGPPFIRYKECWREEHPNSERWLKRFIREEDSLDKVGENTILRRRRN